MANYLSRVRILKTKGDLSAIKRQILKIIFRKENKAMKPVNHIFLYKKIIGTFLLLSLAVLVLSACDDDMYFPDFGAREVNSEEITSDPRIDIYIQGVHTMRGFTAIPNSVYIRTLGLLQDTRHASEWGVNFHRFDIPGMNRTDNEAPFYSISPADFGEARAVNSTFYSLDWIANHSVLGYRFDALHSANRESAGVIRQMYIAPLLERLLQSNHPDRLSVVVTDLLDFGLDVARGDYMPSTSIIEDIFGQIGACSDTSIAVFVIPSEYVGESQVPGSIHSVGRSGDTINRPFYIIIMGSSENVYNYAREIRRRSVPQDMDIAYNVLYILMEGKFDDRIGTVVGWNLIIDGAYSVVGGSGIEILNDRSERLIGPERAAASGGILFYSIARRGNNERSIDLTFPNLIGEIYESSGTGRLSLDRLISSTGYLETFDRRRRVSEYFNESPTVTRNADRLVANIGVNSNVPDRGNRYRLVFEYNVEYDWLGAFHAATTENWEGRTTLFLRNYIQALRRGVGVGTGNDWTVIFQRLFIIYHN